MSAPELFMLSLALIMLGFLLVFAAILLWGVRSGEKVSGGGVLLLGPIPVIFGSDVKAVKAVTALAIILMLLVLLFFTLR